MAPLRKLAVPVIRWLIAIVCAVYVIHIFRSNWESFRQALNIDRDTLLLLSAVTVLTQLIASVRFQQVMEKCSQVQLTVFAWFRIFVVGRFLNLFAPQAGNVYKSVILKRSHGISYTDYASSFFGFAWMDVSFHLLVGLMIVQLLEPDLALAEVSAVYLISLALLLVGGLPFALLYLANRVRFGQKWLAWAHEKASQVLRFCVSSLSDPTYLAGFIFLGLGQFLLLSIQFYLCFVTLGVDASFSAITVFYIAAKMTNQVLITPGNFGVREVIFAMVTDQLGLGIDTGAAVSLMLRALALVRDSIFGLAFGGIGLLKTSTSVADEPNS